MLDGFPQLYRVRKYTIIHIKIQAEGEHDMSKVIFQIEGGDPVTIECNLGDNLLEAARRANVAIDAPCSGNGSCGKCRVKLTEGTLDSLQSRHIS